MTTKNRHVVVDGSNIATEGRSLPSLEQLHEAVIAFLAEFPDTTVTVVVDATFGHRIDKSEVKEFDEAVANNELVAPPAGAVGRGDAFVLGIANKANATILSNDSFQEFHGDYPWLFDEGRLIGGKPVPNVGWVFVARVPVRGPVSRKAVRESRSDGDGRRGGRSRRPRSAAKASPEASAPMPVPTAPPPGPPVTKKRAAPPVVAAPTPAEGAREKTAAPPTARDMVNDLMPFIEFVEHHPVGTAVEGVVESYSSHGAYVRIDTVLGYVPLRLMADPPPRSAREVMKIGDSVALVVADFAPSRRSIDCAVPAMASALDQSESATAEVIDALAAEVGAQAAEVPAEVPQTSGSRRRRTKKAPATPVPGTDEQPEVAPPAESAPAAARTGRGRKKAASKPVETAPVDTAPVETAPVETAPVETAEPAATKAAPKKRAARKSAASDSPTAPAEATPAEASPAKKAPAKKVPAKKSAAKKPAAKKPAAKKSAPAAEAPVAKPAPAKKAPAKPAPAKKAPAKAAAKKAAAKKAPAKAAAKKAPATKAAAKTTPATKRPTASPDS